MGDMASDALLLRYRVTVGYTPYLYIHPYRRVHSQSSTGANSCHACPGNGSPELRHSGSRPTHSGCPVGLSHALRISCMLGRPCEKERAMGAKVLFQAHPCTVDRRQLRTGGSFPATARAGLRRRPVLRSSVRPPSSTGRPGGSLCSVQDLKGRVTPVQTPCVNNWQPGGRLSLQRSLSAVQVNFHSPRPIHSSCPPRDTPAAARTHTQTLSLTHSLSISPPIPTPMPLPL